MSLSRIVTVVTLAGAVSLASGCGAAKESNQALGAGAEPTTATPTPTPTPTPPPVPTPSVTPRVTPVPTATPTAGRGGNGDASGDNAPATAGGGICGRLGADEIGRVLGVSVSGSAVPGETGCTFDQGGKRGMSVTVLDKSTAAAGGMSGAKSEANSAVEGDPQDVPGIGSAAFVVTGSMFGGPEVQAAGAVQVGGRIISAYLEQHAGMPADRVRTLEVNLLKLIAKEAS